MIFIKKRRYKPLYKKFVTLNKNVQNRRKLMNFKKQKWQKLIIYIKRLSKTRTKSFNLYNHNLYFLPRFNNSFKNQFHYNLKVKQKFSLFYGGLLENYLKKKIHLSLLKPKLKTKIINSNFLLVEQMERRLDTVLYRSHFTLSMRSARQLISHRQIYVNDNLVKSKSFMLKLGDIISINPNFHFLIKNNIYISNLWPLPPKYLQINYKTLQIMLIEDIKFTNFSTHFPFWLDLNSVIKYYKY